MTIKGEYYNERYFEDHLRQFSGRPSTYWRWRIKNIIQLAEPKPGEKILDLGTGVGTVAIECSKHGAQVVGLDYSPSAIRIAQDLYKKHGRGQADFILGDATRIPLPDSSFHKIICADLVEHLTREDFLKMLKECHRVLKEEGQLLIYTPCPTHIFERLKKRNLILKRDTSHVDIKGAKFLLDSLRKENFQINKFYYEVTHIPGYRFLERLLMRIPLIGGLFRRRICISARRI
ncbi:MAG: putative methyltransferase YcgJ [candidate division WS2 bacterium]|nr:putative methyltransferase YcgJ [Candidatus Lithacetigena glycinireducens]